MTRLLRDEEIEIVTRIARMLEPELRKQLLSDLNRARVENVHAEGSIIRFAIEGYIRPPFEGQNPFPFEMKVLDADGAVLDVILYADQNGRLYELEYVRYHDGPIIGPDWATLKLSVTSQG